MSVIRWEDPTPHGNLGKNAAATSKWRPIAAALKERSGEWAVIAEGLKAGTAGALTHRIKKGLVACFSPPGTFEARGRSDDSGLVTVYARYIGGESS